MNKIAFFVLFCGLVEASPNYAKIKGTVCDQFQNPLPMAYIELEPEWSGFRIAQSYWTKTDQNGFYSIDHLLEGVYTAYVKYGYKKVSERLERWIEIKGIEVKGEVEFNITIDMDSFLEGYIRDEFENPIPDVKIHLGYPIKHGLDAYAITDKSGYYLIQGLKSGPYEIRFYPKKELNLISCRETIIFIYPGKNTLDITFPIGGTVKGRVLDEEGRPVSSVMVTEGRNSAYTDSNGDYTLSGLEEDIQTIRVYPYGLNLVSSSSAMYVKRKEVSTCNFILPIGGVIVGSVKTLDGKPCFNYRVLASGSKLGYAFTDKDGFFRIVGLMTGTHTVSALGTYTEVYVIQRQTVTTSFVVPMKESEEKPVPQGSLAIVGTITDYLGRPVWNVDVRAIGKDGIYSAMTDKNGIYQVTGLFEGSYRIEAYPPKGSTLAPKTGSITINEGTTTYNIILNEGGRIKIRLKDKFGKPPIELFKIKLEYENGYSYKEIDAYGNVSFFGLPSGTYTISTGEYGYKLSPFTTFVSEGDVIEKDIIFSYASVELVIFLRGPSCISPNEDEITYTIDYGSLGQEADDVLIKLRIPPILEYKSDTSGFPVRILSDAIVWNLGSINSSFHFSSFDITFGLKANNIRSFVSRVYIYDHYERDSSEWKTYIAGPKITSINPRFFSNPILGTITITGSNLSEGIALVYKNISINPDKVISFSSQTITALFSLKGLPKGFFSLNVKNPNEDSYIVEKGIFIERPSNFEIIPIRSSVIGENGGNISCFFSDDAVTVNIPKNSLSFSCPITISSVANPPFLPNMVIVFDIGPSGLILSHPATITFLSNKKFSNLTAYTYDEDDRKWKRIDSVFKDGVLLFQVDHFSLIALGYPLYEPSLEKLIIFPNPCRIDKGNNKVIFSHLTQRATIRIYTIAGELIDTLIEEDGDGVYEWSGVRNLASGVYIYVVDSGSSRKTGKLGVIK